MGKAHISKELRSYPRDIDLSGRRMVVRQGKGMKDRTVYLTDTLVNALKDYLEVRGQGVSAHVFLYRNKQVGKDSPATELKQLVIDVTLR